MPAADCRLVLWRVRDGVQRAVADDGLALSCVVAFLVLAQPAAARASGRSDQLKARRAHGLPPFTNGTRFMFDSAVAQSVSICARAASVPAFTQRKSQSLCRWSAAA